MNKDYAQKVDYNKWGNFFGIYLSYADSGSANFSNAARFNGQLRGVMWNSQGMQSKEGINISMIMPAA